MFGFTGIQELFVLMFVIAVLSATGLWPRIMQGIRELRGEDVGNGAPSADDMSMCYKILGLSPSAPWDEVERAYRNKAKIHHPDRGGDEDTMRALNDAYAHLKRFRRKASAR